MLFARWNQSWKAVLHNPANNLIQFAASRESGGSVQNFMEIHGK